jgi:uncharacterized protein YgbK (DUF1537 family)
MKRAHDLDQALPPGLLLAYYGDDFTGSTDAMQALAAAGLPTVLCLSFPGLRCVGLAGDARGRGTDWMDRELPAAFASLAALGAPLLHYKVCSTFDSSPDIGSTGRAMDLGAPMMPGRWVPLVVGVPLLGRYQVFGNLFAASDGAVHRLDRHPAMSRHPVTPMHEADVRQHLARQTPRRLELLDMLQLREGRAAGSLQALLAGDDVPLVALDVLDEQTLQEAGRLVWEQRGAGLFCVASSGLQYALAAYWRSRGWLPQGCALPQAQAVSVIAGVSGSCSPVTAQQIAWARGQGFHVERLDLACVLDPLRRDGEVGRAVSAAAQALAQGRSALVCSAEGPDDPAVLGFEALAGAAGLERDAAARQVGRALGGALRGMLACGRVRRVVVAGGDSSGEVAGALGIEALQVLAHLVPGAPLCRGHSQDAACDGLQIVLKGGQMGDAAFFGTVLAGQAPPGRDVSRA